MCLGAGARAQNEAARRQYKYQIEKRKRNWLQQISIYGAKINQVSQNITGAGLAAQGAYSARQFARRQKLGEASVAYSNMFTKLLQKSKFSELVASGRTGKSVGRVGTIELGDLGRGASEIARAIRQSDYQLNAANAKTRRTLGGYIRQQEAQVAFQPMETVAPPVPVMQNVGMASFMDALSIGSSLIGIGTGGFDLGKKFNWWG